MKSKMEDVKWKKGPPPGKGGWWIYIKGSVLVAYIHPAYIYRHDPDPDLLISFIGGNGSAGRFDKAKDLIEYYAPIGYPEPTAEMEAMQ